MKLRGLLLLILSIGLWPPPPLAAQADFFRGKQIKIVVGFTAGGIIDLWARLFALYLGKFIPGNPTLRRPDPACEDIDLVAPDGRQGPVGTVLSPSFGFGGGGQHDRARWAARPSDQPR